MSDPEQIFSAKQVADRLNLSAAMVRRYGAALEEIIGEPIRQHPRDGRQYTAEQVDVLLRAKRFVEANSRLTVSQALQLALGKAPEVATPAVADGAGDASLALSEALERSLLPELRALRGEIAQLRGQLEKQDSARAIPPASLSAQRPMAFGDGDPPGSGDVARAKTGSDLAQNRDRDKEGGVLVRFARRLERILGRSDL